MFFLSSLASKLAQLALFCFFFSVSDVRFCRRLFSRLPIGVQKASSKVEQSLHSAPKLILISIYLRSLD